MTAILEEVTDDHYYLAGKMSGLEDFGFAAFRKTSLALRTWGWNIVSPAEITEFDTKHPIGSQPWEYYIKRDLEFLIRCKGIILMPGWKESRGARFELMVADTLNMEVYHVDEDMKVQQSSAFGKMFEP